MKNKCFWLGFISSFIFWMCIIFTVIWFFPWHHSKMHMPHFAGMVSSGFYTPDKMRIFYIEDHLFNKKDVRPFEGFVAFDENFNKIDMINSTPELVQSGKISIISDPQMQVIGLISPDAQNGIIWNADKKQFKVIDTKLIKKQIDENTQLVLFISYRTVSKAKP